jgi:hypothetical protein
VCERTNEVIHQSKCVMKREIRKIQVLMMAQIRVIVIYDSNQMKVNIYIKPIVSSEDKQRPLSFYQAGSSRSHAGWPPLSGSIRLSTQ